MSTTIKVQLDSVDKIIKRHGIDPGGHVQQFFTATINRRIERYMPHLTGTMQTKQKYIASPTEIVVVHPGVNVLYYGVKMVNAVTGKGPAFIPEIGFRYKKGTKLKETNIPLNYTKTPNPLAGPFWDERLIAAEAADIEADMQEYLETGKT